MSKPQSPFFQTGASELGSDREAILAQRAEFGGKGAGLHALAAAGYRVPPGFTLSSAFCRSYFEGGREAPAGLREALDAGLGRIEEFSGGKLGGDDSPLRLAVRSGAAVSMPGMMDTVLGVSSREELDSAVLKVFDSWSSDRAETYRREQGILGLEGTAVTVQVLCPAEAAGVVFSKAPGAEDDLLIEAVSGLGESLVSGEVTPDSYRLSRSSLEVVGEQSSGERLLGLEALGELAGLSLRLEDEFGYPVDVEWAWAEGELWLLQVREIPGAAAGEGLEDELRRAAGLLGKDGLLVRHNLDETLSNPAPMTWDIQSEFMSGRGGFGTLYRLLGFSPSARVDHEGFLELVGGRIFADPERYAGLFYSRGILAYDNTELQSRPASIEEPPRLWKTRDASPPDLLRTLIEMLCSSSKAQRGRDQVLDEFLAGELPRFEAWISDERSVDLAKLGVDELYETLEARIGRVMDDFAPKVLKLSFYSSLALDEFEDLMERCLGFQRGAAESRALLGALDGDLAVEQALGLIEVGKSASALQDFLDRFGHRCGKEMELEEKRWWEEPEKVKALGQEMARSEEDFLARRAALSDHRAAVELEVLELLRLDHPDALEPFRELLRETRALLPWRENGKFYWMAGYDLIRRVLVELDERLGLEGNVFYLDRRELKEVLDSSEEGLPGALEDSFSRRRKFRRDLRSLQVPELISASSLADLGNEAGKNTGGAAGEAVAGEVLRGDGISAGSAKGKIWVCSSPRQKPPFEGPYLLVAESTDPDWTPLLAAAGGLVVERGGSLSHGAIVCRDFGVPAMVIEGAGRRLDTGVDAFLDADAGELRIGSSSGGEAEDLKPGECDPGPEPYCAPCPGGTGRRAVFGLVFALLASLLMVSVGELSSRLAGLAGLVLDWWPLAGATPFHSILAASLLGALASIGILALSSDRRKLRRMRVRLRWYRKKTKQAQAAGMGNTASKLRRRMAAAKSDRFLVLLRPIAWTFLPLCLGFIWVNDRFAAEPISPGSRFRVTAFLEPGAAGAAQRLRYARIDAAPGLQVLGSPYSRLEPNVEAPQVSAYRVAWDLEARTAGRHLVSVSAAGEKVKKKVLVTEGIDRAAAIERYGGIIPEIQVDHQPLEVNLPGWLHAGVSRLAAFASGGRGLVPGQTAVGPWTAYLVLAVLLMLALQWLSGYR